MRVADDIQSRLEAALAPDFLDVRDVSAKHKGHAGARPEGETHFDVTLVAAAFEGVSRVARHRMVMKAVGDLMNNPVHALSVSASAPGEKG